MANTNTKVVSVYDDKYGVRGVEVSAVVIATRQPNGYYSFDTLATTVANIDVPLSEIATEATLQTLLANLGLSSEQTPIYEFAENSVPVGIETTVLNYVVPTGKTLTIKAAKGWGDGDGEWLLRIDGIQKAGGRTTAANLTYESFFFRGLSAGEGEAVSISVLRSYGSTPTTMKATLEGFLSNV